MSLPGANELWQFTSSHPDCTHCGTILRAITVYDQRTHDTCPCVCHRNKTTQAKYDLQQSKRKKKK